MSRRVSRPVLLLTTPLLVAAVTLATAVAPAQAVVRDHDSGDVPKPYDTQTFSLYPNYAKNVVVQMTSSTYRVGARFNGVDVYLDTRGGPAVDYRLTWDFKGDGDGHALFALYRVDGSDVVASVSCPGLSGRGRSRAHTVEMHVPRGCLTIKKGVRARTEAWDYTHYTAAGVPDRGHVDRAPNRGYLR